MLYKLRLLGLAAAAALVLAALVLPVRAEVPAGEFDLRDFIESEYAVLRDTSADRGKVRQGGEFTLALRITPFEGLHIYGAEETDNMSVIPSELTLKDAPGIEWGEMHWPPAERHEGVTGISWWLEGQVVVLIDGRVAADAEPGTRTLEGELLFGACTKEFCLAPSLTTEQWEIEVVPAGYAGEIAVVGRADLLADADISRDRYSFPETEGEVGGGLDLEGDKAMAAATGEDGGSGVDLGNLDIKKSTELPIWQILVLALLGGLILNVMPCVLPVVSIKVIDLVGAVGGDHKPADTVRHGLLFAVGIVATFLAGAAVIAIIQALGNELNWGFQFQNPTFVLVMSIIIFLFGLSLADVFKIKAPAAVTAGGGTLAKSEGASGSFFKGVLATVLGTPCVGPFLGPALAVAFTLTWMHTILIFLFVGIGMALPYLIMLPFLGRLTKRDRGRLSRKLQQSTGWMDHFKHAMAFLMFATVIYLLYIMQGVMGGTAVIWALVLLLGVGVAAWLWGTLIHLKRNPYLWAAASAILALVVFGWLALPNVYAQADGGGGGQAISAATHAGWEDFSLAALQEHTAAERSVLIDFTADWCPNCKTNEAVALNIDSTMELKDELGMVFMVADFTQRDKEISDVLRMLGFTSVPLTAIFPGNDPNAPILLDGLFSADRLQDAMREAAER